MSRKRSDDGDWLANIPKKTKAADLRGQPLENRARDYFFSSFFGLHFSQVLPSLAALTQQACSQVLPAAFALSQQDSARTETAESTARAQVMATSDLIAFIYFTFVLPVTQPGDCIHSHSSLKRPSLIESWVDELRVTIFEGGKLSIGN